MNSGHFYQREFDPQGQDSLARLGRWITPGSTVLELGPGSGYFTRYLAQGLNCVVDAVEYDPVMAEHVRPWCRRLIVADLDTWDADAELVANSYDILILADVLEHLRQPEQVLRNLQPLLKPEGQVLISVPNVAYAGLIADLVRGDFEYQDEGLLDRTHLHFFTRRSLLAMLERLGLYVWSCEGVRKPLAESEFASRLEILPTAMREVITGMPDAFCYQWLVAARREPPLQPVEISSVSRDAFPVRIFWSDDGEAYDYARSSVAWVPIGEEKAQAVEWILPAMVRGKVRIRLADRPGYVRLYLLELIRRDGSEVWRWRAEQGASALSGEVQGVVLQNGGSNDEGRDGVVAVIHDAESWLTLPFTVEGMGEMRLRAVLTWPMSADYRAAQRGWESTAVRLQTQLQYVEASVAERDQKLMTKDLEIEQLNRVLSDNRETIRAQENSLRDTQEFLRYRTSLKGWLRLPFSELKRYLKNRHVILRKKKR